MIGGQSTNIPMKVNTAGVIPVIFASSLMSFPGIILALMGKSAGTGIGGKIITGLSSSSWCNPPAACLFAGLLLYIVLVVFFAYFYTSITFNPLEIADNMKKQGGFIPGIRPGRPYVRLSGKNPELHHFCRCNRPDYCMCRTDSL